MKKILAVAVAVLMTVALCIGASAMTSLDRVSINHNVLGEMGNDVADGTLTIAKGDKVYILGWAVNADTDSNLKEVVYTIDGTEYKCADNYRDRPGLANAIGLSNTDLDTHAGIGKDDDAFELTGLDKLGDGTYAMELLAKYEDGSSETLGGGAGAFTLVVGTGVKAEDPEPTTDPTPTTNPTTADASVIAIAAVACVALAGVVVAKKVR